MGKSISDAGLDILFRKARTFNSWEDKPISNTHIQALYELLKWAPTSANSAPARFIFIASDEAREKLKPCLDEGNIVKTMTAPLTVIIGQDLDFPDSLATLFPHADAKSWFEGNQNLIEDTAFRSSSLQGAYLMLAARALGFDCGPMSGFDKEKTDATFFKGTNIKSNFLCNLGYGTPEGLFERGPRPAFDDVCTIL